MKINYRCKETLRPDNKLELDSLIPDVIQNGSHFELPENIDVRVGFTDPLNQTCLLTIYHPKGPITVKHKFSC